MCQIDEQTDVQMGDFDREREIEEEQEDRLT